MTDDTEPRRQHQLDAPRQLAAIPTRAADTHHYDYTPQIPEEQWAAIGPFVHKVVRQTAPATPYSEKQLYPAATRLTLYAWGTAGLPLEEDVVFDPSVINRYTQTEADHRSRAGVSTIRARLRRMSETLLGDDATGRFHALGKADASRPYSMDEQASLRSWAGSQRDSSRRSSAEALLALGLGAGLTGREIISLRVDNVAVDDAGVVIHVGAVQLRQVPVLRAWEAHLDKRVQQAEPGTWVFRDGQRGGNVNLVTDFVSRAPRPSVQLQARRMRATWIVGHLGRGTPLAPLMVAAGLQSAEAFDRFLPFVGPSRGDEDRQCLR
jgi:integrase